MKIFKKEKPSLNRDQVSFFWGIIVADGIRTHIAQLSYCCAFFLLKYSYSPTRVLHLFLYDLYEYTKKRKHQKWCFFCFFGSGGRT